MSKDILSETILKDGRTLILRKADYYDAEDMLEYLNAIGGESDNLTFGRDGFRHMTVKEEAEHIEKTNQSPTSLMILGFVGNELVSMSHIDGSARERVAHNFDLSITVRKAYWNSGVGSAVMAELINFAKQHGARAIHLCVREGNDMAVKLYKKFGFKVTGLRRGYFNVDGKYYDAILMSLYIQ